jgi:hypothetical protein
MTDQIEIGPRQQVRDVRFLAREEVVEADHIVAERNQAFAQVRTEETRAAGDENAFEHGGAGFQPASA